MDYCSLMSGSWGNCHFVRAGETSILIDAGQSGKRILTNMAIAGCGDGSCLSAILVTHAHRDHITGVGVLARRLKLPVYATEGAWYEMGAIADEIPQEYKRVIDCSEKWRIGALGLEAFPTSHDALESVGFVLRHQEQGIGVATDCGVFTNRMKEILQDLPLLVLEANHDVDMLRRGRYPAYLKKRIAGIDGHLSNEDAAAGLLKILGRKTKNVLLAHLSQENNTPEKALKAISEALPAQGPRPALAVAPRCTPGAWISVT
jgi:phosphoribosyl 1,2-cyclic phosphodiesterase